MFCKKKNNKGFSVLIAVVTVGVAGLTAVFLLSASSVGMLKRARAQNSFHDVKTVADSCAEIALQQIQKKTTFTGTYTVGDTVGSCTYSVVNAGTGKKTINVAFTKGEYVRRVRISLDALTPKLHVASWQEVAI